MTKKAFGYFSYVFVALMLNAASATAGILPVANIVECNEVCVELSADNDLGFGQTSCTLPNYGGSQMTLQRVFNIDEKQHQHNLFGTIPSEAIIKNNNLHYHSYAKNIPINLSVRELLFPFHSFL